MDPKTRAANVRELMEVCGCPFGTAVSLEARTYTRFLLQHAISPDFTSSTPRVSWLNPRVQLAASFHAMVLQVAMAAAAELKKNPAFFKDGLHDTTELDKFVSRALELPCGEHEVSPARPPAQPTHAQAQDAGAAFAGFRCPHCGAIMFAHEVATRGDEPTRNNLTCTNSACTRRK